MQEKLKGFLKAAKTGGPINYKIWNRNGEDLICEGKTDGRRKTDSGCLVSLTEAIELLVDFAVSAYKQTNKFALLSLPMDNFCGLLKDWTCLTNTAFGRYSFPWLYMCFMVVQVLHVICVFEKLRFN
ncbi:hypothetical protein L798_13249 [Zootermopsis nevadensis]|uniref:Uncharacterized protein n=1 Tax=Zootermopsis nevadensis TaxID=136037 RepID=A0A067R1Q0_ZOONE|nr:hypothetical protein L798_13249 [Zootermopsis nevadensis]